MAKDTRNHRNPSVVNRLPRGRDETSLWRVLRPARVEEASACGLCRGHEAAVRTQGTFQPCYGRDEASWCALPNGVPSSKRRSGEQRSILRPPHASGSGYPSWAAIGRAMLDPSGPARVGMEPSSVLWYGKRWEAEQHSQYCSRPPPLATVFRPRRPDRLLRWNRNDGPSLAVLLRRVLPSHVPRWEPSLAAVGSRPGAAQFGTRHWQRIPQSVPCGAWRQPLQVRLRRPRRTSSRPWRNTATA